MRQDIRIAIGLVFVGLLGALLLCEAGVRCWEHWHPIRAVRSDRPWYYYAADDVKRVKNFPFSEEKPSGVFRIAVVGDSFSYPHILQFDDVYERRLERILNLHQPKQKHLKRPLVEVVSYATPGASTANEVPNVKKAIQHQADLVILEITLNDPEFHNLHELEAHHPDRYSFGEMLIDKEHHPFYYYFRTAGLLARRLHNSATHRCFINYHKDLFFNKDTWTTFSQSIRSMKNLTEKNNVRFFAFVFPLFTFALDENYPFYDVHRKIESFLTDENILHVDLLYAFNGLPHNRLQVLPGQDSHPSEVAHRIAAEQLYLWLEYYGLIPKETRLAKKYRQRHVEQGHYRNAGQIIRTKTQGDSVFSSQVERYLEVNKFKHKHKRVKGKMRSKASL